MHSRIKVFTSLIKHSTPGGFGQYRNICHLKILSLTLFSLLSEEKGVL